MVLRGPTIWQLLEQCVGSLSEPFRASEIIGWFRRHHPEVNEPSVRAHIQAATSNVSAESRGAMAGRTPLITRVGHGLYIRHPIDDAEIAPLVSSPRLRVERTSVGLATTTDPGWYAEVQIQSRVVAHLVREGWSITSVADTASRERGIDVVASKGDRVIGVEVKGYPGREYADPQRSGEVKRAHPSAQAGTYFAQAVLSAMRLRGSRPDLVNVIALPDFPRYRRLVGETSRSLAACGIDVWLVDEGGSISKPLEQVD